VIRRLAVVYSVDLSVMRFSRNAASLVSWYDSFPYARQGMIHAIHNHYDPYTSH
jgi:hypothetical protein